MSLGPSGRFAFFAVIPAKAGTQRLPLLVIPAQAGIQGPLHERDEDQRRWIPAFAGMTTCVGGIA
jgi:hypothetical protein